MLPVLLVISPSVDAKDPLRVELSAAGLKTYYVETLASALGVISQWQFDAVLVDADLHGPHFLGIVRGLRQDTQIPILALSRGADEDLMLEILAAGANQVMPYQAYPRLVAAQLHRLIELSRPRHRDGAGRVTVGPLWLDPSRAVATLDGNDVKLTSREFELLLLLAADPGELVHRDKISKTLGVGSIASRRRGADMHICRIRRKLKKAGAERLEVVTVYGQGYLLQHSAAQASAADVPRVEWSV